MLPPPGRAEREDRADRRVGDRGHMSVPRVEPGPGDHGGQPDGLLGIPALELFGKKLNTGRSFFYLLWTIVVLAAIAMTHLLDSRAGRAMREAIFRAYFGEGRDVGRIDVLVEIGAMLGMDPTELKVVLDVDTFGGAVDGDRALARRLGIEAVPALVAGAGAAARLIVGAQPYAALRALLVEMSPGAAASG